MRFSFDNYQIEIYTTIDRASSRIPLITSDGMERLPHTCTTHVDVVKNKPLKDISVTITAGGDD